MTDRPPEVVPSADPDATRPQPESQHTSRAIGPYRLIQIIGEGGMGEVWLAEQTHPVRRQVAVKVIKAGMDTVQVVTRFEAERQALALVEQLYGPDHRIVGDTVNNMGSFYEDQKRYAEAERYYRRALDIYGKTLGPDHSDVGMALHNMANLYRDLGRPAEAEPLYLRSYAIWVKSLGPEHSSVAASLRERGTLYRDTGRTAEAEVLYRKALALQERTSGPTHPSVAETLNEYAKLLRKVGRAEEAGALETRAKGVRIQAR